MNIPTFRTRLNTLLALGGMAILPAAAQVPGASGPGMGPAMMKLFGDIQAFTAKANVQVLDDSKKEMVNMPMDFAMLDKKIRIEVDLSQVKNANMPPGTADQLKQMGMAQVISIIRPDKNLAYVVYPGQKALMSVPLPKETADAATNAGKLTKTSLGNETVDGHPCTKNKVVLTDDAGKPVEATTWNASDLKDFPVQIQTSEKESTSLMRFSQVQFTKPDAQQFEPPAGYTVYKSQQEMMQGLMQKMTEGAGKK
jgi:hypothetical protein